MSAFARFLRPIPASRRGYSSFFSSKSGGGGRYFTSAKPPKVVVTTKGTAPKAEQAAEPSADGSQAAGATETNGNTSPVITADQPSKTSSQSSTPSSSASPAPGNTTACEAPHSHGTTSNISGNSAFLQRPHHPIVNAKDFKLHQFFSLHRPLLLLAQPNSILESANAASFLPQEAVQSEAHSTSPQWLLDEFSEATADADAAAARQLTRALTMSHAGAAMSWEDTLRRLGLDVNKDVDRISLQEKWDKEWQDVLMDSTKRKRRKKMKKHKLKKRRKATRAARLKIGR